MELARVAVTPLHGQVSVHDVGTAELPEWESGEEYAVGSRRAVLIATRGDADGDVVMSIGEDEGDVTGTLVFDGVLHVRAPALEFGSLVGADVHQVALCHAGPWHVRVFVTPPLEPDTVTVLLAEVE